MSTVDACQLLLLFHFRIPLPTLQLFDTVWHFHPVLPVTLHGTPLIYSTQKGIFKHKRCPTSELPFQNENATTVKLACEVLCTPIHILHLMATFTGTCQVLSNMYIPFPVLPHFVKKKKNKCHDLWPTYVRFTAQRDR